MCTKFWSEKCKGKRQLGRPGHRWVANIRMYIKEIGCIVLNNNNNNNNNNTVVRTSEVEVILELLSTET